MVVLDINGDDVNDGDRYAAIGTAAFTSDNIAAWILADRPYPTLTEELIPLMNGMWHHKQLGLGDTEDGGVLTREPGDVTATWSTTLPIGLLPVHDHESAGGGGTLDVAAIASGIFHGEFLGTGSGFLYNDDLTGASVFRSLLADDIGTGTGGYLWWDGLTTQAWTAPAALTKVDDANVTLTLGGSHATALLQAATITVGWTGYANATRLGTGSGKFLSGDGGLTTNAWVDLVAADIPALDASKITTGVFSTDRLGTGGANGDTDRFLRRDGTWSNALSGDLAVSGNYTTARGGLFNSATEPSLNLRAARFSYLRLSVIENASNTEWPILQSAGPQTDLYADNAVKLSLVSAGVNIPGLTASRPLALDSGQNIVSPAQLPSGYVGTGSDGFLFTSDITGAAEWRAIAVADLPLMTSAELATILSDETGSGKAVFSLNPTLRGRPVIGYDAGSGTSGVWFNNSSDANMGFFGSYDDTHAGFYVGGWEFLVSSGLGRFINQVQIDSLTANRVLLSDGSNRLVSSAAQLAVGFLAQGSTAARRFNAVAAGGDTYATWDQIVASDISSGTIATARLGSGTANSTTVLRGDQVWASEVTGSWAASSGYFGNASGRIYTSQSSGYGALNSDDGVGGNSWVIYDGGFLGIHNYRNTPTVFSTNNTDRGRFTAAGLFQVESLTASLPVFTNGSKQLVSNAMTGTGSVVMNLQPVLTGGSASDGSGTYQWALAFGYNGGTDYKQFIKTRHNSSPANNAFDFYTGIGDGGDGTIATAVLGLTVSNGAISTPHATIGHAVAGYDAYCKLWVEGETGKHGVIYYNIPVGASAAVWNHGAGQTGWYKSASGVRHYHRNDAGTTVSTISDAGVFFSSSATASRVALWDSSKNLVSSAAQLDSGFLGTGSGFLFSNDMAEPGVFRSIAAADIGSGSGGALVWDGVTDPPAWGSVPVAYGGTGVTSAFTAGSVIFSNGSALAQDNSNFSYSSGATRLTVSSAKLGLLTGAFSALWLGGRSGLSDYILAQGSGGDSSTYINAPTGNPILFSIQDVEKARMTSAGRWLLGTTTDDGSSRLQVSGNAVATGSVTSISGSDYARFYHNSGVPTVQVFDSGVEEFSLTASAGGMLCNRDITATEGLHTLTGFLELQGQAGDAQYIQFWESGVAFHGTLGYAAGDSTLTYRYGATTMSNGTVGFTANASGDFTATRYVYANGGSFFAPNNGSLIAQNGYAQVAGQNGPVYIDASSGNAIFLRTNGATLAGTVGTAGDYTAVRDVVAGRYLSSVSYANIGTGSRSGSHGTPVGLYVTGDMGPDSGGVEFRHDNGTQGVGIGFNTLYATGSNTNVDLNLKSKGSGVVRAYSQFNADYATASRVALFDSSKNLVSSAAQLDYNYLGANDNSAARVLTINAPGDSYGTWASALPVALLPTMTSAELAGKLSDETGYSSGALAVFSKSPTFQSSSATTYAKRSLITNDSTSFATSDGQFADIWRNTDTTDGNWVGVGAYTGAGGFAGGWGFQIVGQSPTTTEIAFFTYNAGSFAERLRITGTGIAASAVGSGILDPARLGAGTHGAGKFLGDSGGDVTWVAILASDLAASPSADQVLTYTGSAMDWVSTIAVSAVPSLPASKITSGILDPALLGAGAHGANKFLGDSGGDVTWVTIAAGDLPAHNHSASQITSGILDPTRLGAGTHGAHKFLGDSGGDVTWVSLVAGDIPSLAASIITSGIFTPTLLAGGSNGANKVIQCDSSGDPLWVSTFTTGVIPNLATSKITSGEFIGQRLGTGSGAFLYSTDLTAASTWIDAATMRTNLGLVIGTNVQAYDADLAAFAGLTSGVNLVPYYTGTNSMATTAFTAAGRAIVGVAAQIGYANIGTSDNSVTRVLGLNAGGAEADWKTVTGSFGSVVLSNTPTITTPSLVSPVCYTPIIDYIQRIGSAVTNTEHGPWNPLLYPIDGGIAVYGDPEFASGSNSVTVYDTGTGGHVTHTRQTGDGSEPNWSGKWIKISFDGNTAASPGAGGFQHAWTPSRNSVIVQRFIAKIPVGKTLAVDDSSQGTNSTSYWLTANVGTGKWEEYCRVVHCGNTGTFTVGGGGKVYIVEDNAAFDWYLAAAEVFRVERKGSIGSGSLLRDTAVPAWVFTGTVNYNGLATNAFAPKVNDVFMGSGATELEMTVPVNCILREVRYQAKHSEATDPGPWLISVFRNGSGADDQPIDLDEVSGDANDGVATFAESFSAGDRIRAILIKDTGGDDIAQCYANLTFVFYAA